MSRHALATLLAACLFFGTCTAIAIHLHERPLVGVTP